MQLFKWRSLKKCEGKRSFPHSCFPLEGQDIAAGYLEGFAVVVANFVKLPYFSPRTEKEVLIMKFYIRMSLTTHWLLGSIITGNMCNIEKTDSA